MTVRSLVPLAHVSSVARSIAFYERLGFTVGNAWTPEGAAEPSWVWLQSDSAALMLARASHPFEAQQQAVLFYVYVADVQAKRDELRAAGIEAGEIAFPFFSPRGEFRVVDPDGYVLMISHSGA